MIGIGAIGEARADQRTLKSALLGDADASIFELRPLATGGRQDFLAHGVIDHAMLDPSANAASDRDGKLWKAVQKVGGAIKWINDPLKGAVADGAAFLTEEGVIRIGPTNDLDNFGFGCSIDFRHKVITTLTRDFQGVEAIEATDDHVCGAACGAHGDIEKCLHAVKERNRKRARISRAMTTPTDIHPPAQIRIVLVETSHPGNIGAVARAMKNMGLRDLSLVRPKSFPHSEASARASGATDLLASARVVDSVEAAIADCALVIGTTSREREHNFRIWDVREAAERAHDVGRQSPVAFLFGNERAGLSNDELAQAHALLRIPTSEEYPSLNLAMAVQIVSYEILRARGMEIPSAPSVVPPATAEQIEQFYAHLQEVMNDVGFRDRTQGGTSLMTRLRRLFGRTDMDQNEVNILRGFLTAVQQKRRMAGQRTTEPHRTRGDAP